MKLLLLAGSKVSGGGYFEFAKEWIQEHFSGLNGKPVLFVPYALMDHDGYTAKVAGALKPLGIDIVSAHTRQDPKTFLDRGEVGGILVGGGNTFRLLDEMQGTGLLLAIERAVRAGMPFMGSSAGTNVACPTIKTTNDMPIREPRQSLGAMSLVGFQINPHYLDPNPAREELIAAIMRRTSEPCARVEAILSVTEDLVPPLKHQGETRETRITEFHEENDTPVLGLREGTALRVDGTRIELLGGRKARLFRMGEQAIELTPGDITAFLPIQSPGAEAQGAEAATRPTRRQIGEEGRAS